MFRFVGLGRVEIVMVFGFELFFFGIEGFSRDGFLFISGKIFIDLRKK